MIYQVIIKYWNPKKEYFDGDAVIKVSEKEGRINIEVLAKSRETLGEKLATIERKLQNSFPTLLTNPS